MESEKTSKCYYLGREIKEQVSFKEKGTFKSYWQAQSWLRKKGYVDGSICVEKPVAVVKGDDYSCYKLPQKWINMTDEDIASIDGVMLSRDFREGEVTVILFN